MRKLLAGILCVMMAWPCLAWAETTSPILILTGKVEAKETTTVYAPFGGPVKDFTLNVGDRVEAGDVLLSLDTGKVYAPCDGTVRGVFASRGDSAAYVQGRYGALCYIEPDESLTVSFSTGQGYDSADKRFIHMGEPVYVRVTNDSRRQGEGRIISIVNGDTYGVEILSGTLEINDNVSIFREENNPLEPRIGRGTVTRMDPVAVTADGAVLTVLAKEGARVSRGDLLFEMVSGTLDRMEPTSAKIIAPEDSIVSSVSVTPGQVVTKQQAVATLYRLDQLQLVSTVSEVDAAHVQVGGKVRLSFDSIPERDFTGVIRSISGIGNKSDNYTEYDVYIDFTPDEHIRLGMSGTAYPEE